MEIAGQANRRMLKFMCVTCVHTFISGLWEKLCRREIEREREREDKERCKQLHYIFACTKKLLCMCNVQTTTSCADYPI